MLDGSTLGLAREKVREQIREAEQHIRDWVEDWRITISGKHPIHIFRNQEVWCVLAEEALLVRGLPTSRSYCFIGVDARSEAYRFANGLCSRA